MEGYYEGMEIGVQIVKDILSLSTHERMERFGKTDITQILDDFDFTQLKDLMAKEIVLNKRYVIRGIVDRGTEKKVISESIKYKMYPSDDMILEFWSTCPDATFIVVEEIYIREFKG